MDDQIEKDISCAICCDLLFQASSVSPCNHSFCGHCLSKSLTTSRGSANECPYCRITVQQVNRNTTLDSLVRTFIQHHPDRELSIEDKAVFESQNKIEYGKPCRPKSATIDSAAVLNSINAVNIFTNQYGMPPSNWVTFLNMPLTSHSVAITAGVCHVIAGLCQNSSHMRSELHDHGVCESLMILLSSRLALQYPSLAENVCSAVNSLVCKDTRNMAKFHELGVCQKLVSLLTSEEAQQSSGLTANACHAVAALCDVNDENSEEFAQLNICQVLTDIIRSPLAISSGAVAEGVCRAIWVISFVSHATRAKLGSLRVSEGIVEMLRSRQHPSAGLVEQACRCVVWLCTGNAGIDNAALLTNAGICRVLVPAIRIHCPVTHSTSTIASASTINSAGVAISVSNCPVTVWGCYAVRNLVRACPKSLLQMQNAGVDELLTAVLRTPGGDAVYWAHRAVDQMREVGEYQRTVACGPIQNQVQDSFVGQSQDQVVGLDQIVGLGHD